MFKKIMANYCINDVKILPVEDEFTEEQMESIEEFFKSEEDDRWNMIGEVTFNEVDPYYIELTGDSKWNVKSEEWLKFAKRFNVNVLIVGREDGVGFIQVVKAYADGGLLDEELDLII